MPQKRPTRIGSAIFNADHGHLADAVTELDRAGIDFFHWDVFDGHLIPELGFPPRTLAAVRSLSGKPFEVHLAAVDLRRFLAPLADAGADLVFVPAESAPMLFEAVSWARQAGLQAGVSIAVGTPVQAIEEVLPHVDSVLVLGRIYGEAAGKTSFLAQATSKVAVLRDMADRQGLGLDIEAAGSLSIETARAAVAAGADAVVFGGALHKAESLTKRLRELREALESSSA